MKQEERRQKYPRIPGRNVNKVAFVLLLLMLTGVPFLFFTNAQTKKEQNMNTVKDNEAAIRALMDRFAAAFNAGDLDAIMKCYLPGKDLVVFDVVPRKQHLGADAYRAGFEDMFSRFRGKPQIAIIDPGITVDGNVGFSHCFMRVTGTDTQGQPVNRLVRVTDGFRRIDGNWLIALEHISVPVDFATGKLVPLSKP